METLTLSTPSETKPLRISVSQIKLFERCARAYFYEYGEPKRKSPSTKAAAFGSEVHTVLEGYLQGEEIPETRAGRVASAGLKHLRPADELEIEANILMPVGDTGARILCRVDMLGTGEPYIGDHKTTSDFRWARSVHEISSDLQLLTYAYAAYHETQPEEVAVELVYYRTKGLPVSMAVGASVPWDRIADNWRQVVEVVPKLQAIRENKTGAGIVGNSGACGDYGGCFHCDICPFSPEGLAKSVSRDNIGSGTTHKQQTTNSKEEIMKTTQSAKNLQNSLGLSRILPSKAPPQVEQTPELITSTGQAVADYFDEYETLSVDAAFKFLEKQGVEPSNLSAVLEAAGAGIDIEAQEIRLFEAEPTPEPMSPEKLASVQEQSRDMAQAVGPTVGEITRREPPAVFVQTVAEATVFQTVNKQTLEALADELGERYPDGVIGEDGRAYCQSRIAPNKKISDRRWDRIVELSGLLTIAEEAAGYTEHPQAHDGEADAPAEEAEVFSVRYRMPAAYSPGAPQAADLGPAPEAPRAKTRRQIAEKQKDIEHGIVNLEQTIDALPYAALPGGLVVLVDCLFEKSPEARTLTDYLAPHQEAVEAQNGVDYFEEIGFGKGPKMVLAKVLADVMSAPPRGVFIVNSREPMAEAVIAIFRRVPGVVIIRGLR